MPAAPAIADWLKANIPNAFVIGPDEESEQWVLDVAERAGIPSAVLEKKRWGDFDVAISGGRLPDMDDKQPVIIDDIASSARTLVETVKLLSKAGTKPPVCCEIDDVTDPL